MSLIEIANFFCRENEARLSTFWKLVRRTCLSILSLVWWWQHSLSNIFLCFLFLTVSLTKYNNWTFRRIFYSFVVVLEISKQEKTLTRKPKVCSDLISVLFSRWSSIIWNLQTILAKFSLYNEYKPWKFLISTFCSF